MGIKKMGMFILLGIVALFIVGCNSNTSTDNKGDSEDSVGYTGGDLHVALNTQPPH